MIRAESWNVSGVLRLQEESCPNCAKLRISTAMIAEQERREFNHGSSFAGQEASEDRWTRMDTDFEQKESDGTARGEGQRR
jgi:hypothetical protein